MDGSPVLENLRGRPAALVGAKNVNSDPREWRDTHWSNPLIGKSRVTVKHKSCTILSISE